MNQFMVKLSKLLPDKLYINLMFYKHFGKFVNWKHPKTFNEKLQWLKLYDRHEEYCNMADKIAAKEYVAKKIGYEHIIPTLEVWDSCDEINFESLPERFVLKTNHDSKGVVVCNDKAAFDFHKAKNILNKHLRKSGFWYGREWPYKNITPKVFAEEYLENNYKELTDYKIHCFNGVPKLILVCQGRFNEPKLYEDFFDENWNHLDIKRPGNPCSPVEIPKPNELSEILSYARILAKGIPFLRVDFYIVKARVYFGELTFYPASGFVKFEPEDADRYLGDLLKLV